jgi:hypothetical protein
MTSLENILTNYLESYMQDVYTCMPAIVLNVKDMGQLRVDVKPLVNHRYKDGITTEYPTLSNVPLVMPCSLSAGVTFPINQGDTVLLLCSQKDLTFFKEGADRPHEPNTRRWNNLNDFVAVAGLFPFVKSPNRDAAHKLPHSTDDVVVYQNLGKENECEVRLKKDGSIKVKGKRIDLDAQDGVFINGLSFGQHTHQYTDDGVPSQTQPPTGAI